jgi:hypothetical protein
VSVTTRRFAVDSKHKLIVEQEVTNADTDLGLLAPTASAAKEVLEAEWIKVVADSGYYKGEDIAACEAAGIEAYVARPQRGSAVREGLFRKEEFHGQVRDVVSIYDMRYKDSVESRVHQWARQAK